MKRLGLVAVTAALALTFAALAFAGAAKEVYNYKATLTPGQEVPKPTGAKAGAGGTFTASVTESGSTRTLHFTLTFHTLTGKAMAAHIHLGVKGKAGNVLVPLCAAPAKPCKSGLTGTMKISKDAGDAMEAGKTYVNVHTAKNAGGEIRGQVKLVSHA